MKKTTLLNADLSYSIATLGHTDSLTLCDAGLPIPATNERIDLSLTAGIPSLLQTLAVVGEEMFIERATLAAEIKEKSPEIHQAILEQLKKIQSQQGNTIAVNYVLHDTFKAQTHASKAIVRTGECTPFANIILYAGVPF